MKKITYTLYPSSCVEQYFAHKCERLVLYKGLNKEGKKETVSLLPFISCSAKIPAYMLFANILIM